MPFRHPRAAPVPENKKSVRFRTHSASRTKSQFGSELTPRVAQKVSSVPNSLWADRRPSGRMTRIPSPSSSRKPSLRSRERATRVSRSAVTRPWREQIPIESERRVGNPASPGAKPVAKLARDAGHTGRRGETPNRPGANPVVKPARDAGRPGRRGETQVRPSNSTHRVAFVAPPSPLTTPQQQWP
jgi:hypothetical protein